MTTDPRETFSRSADRYLDSTDHRTGPDLMVISETARALQPRLTVDIASGAGHALKAAVPFSAFGIAVDLTAQMLKVARENLERAGLTGAGFVQARAEDLPVPHESAGLVTCRIACHHFSSITDFLSEVRRILAPHGSFIMVDSIVPSNSEAGDFLNRLERLRDPSHVRSLNMEQWLEFFRKIKLPVSSVSTFERVHSFTEWSRRVLQDEDSLRKLEGEFKNAPDHIKEEFRIEQDPDGSVISYTDKKVIIVAEKR